MNRVVQFHEEPSYIDEFLSLPKKLYTKKEITQNWEEEKEIITNTHTLSHYFLVYKFLVLNEKNCARARAILTFYPEEENAYVGYFECENNTTVSDLLFQKLENFTKENGRTKIIGPFDASIWIKYRLKINEFQTPYTGEPYNKDYYYNLFVNANFSVKEAYKSNQYFAVGENINEKKYLERLQRARKKGYKFLSPKSNNFDKYLKEVYHLLIEVYQNFYGYQFITEEEFVEIFQYLSKIIHYEMVKLVYDQKKLIGFFISIPNYKNRLYGKLSISDYLNIIKTKLFPKEFVMLYMGIDPNYLGLGKALTEVMKEELKKNKATSIGALIHRGNVNENDYKSLIEKEYHYVLMEKLL